MFGGGIGWQEIILVLLIVLLLFGAKRVPEIMRSFGKGVKEFKNGMKEITSTDTEDKEKKEEDKK